MDNTDTIITGLISDRGFETAKIIGCEDLFQAGMLDSIAVIQLALRLEKEFGIHVRAGEITYDHFRSVPAIARFVEEKRAREKQ